MGKRGPKPKAIVDTEWRPSLAYIVGLIAADGCLSPDGRHIDLTSKDKEQLETFKQVLGLTHIKIGTKKGGYTGGVCYRVEFGSVLFYDWLVSIGLHPRKSKTIQMIAVPDSLFADFLRGLFDGDGCIYAYQDTRWKNSYLYYLDFASASKEFLEWLQYTCKRLFGVAGVVRPMRANRVFVLRFAKRESETVLNQMYAQDGTPRLTRKFTKVEKIRMMDARR